MKSYINKFLLGLAVVSMTGLASCVNDLDQAPQDPNKITSGDFGKDPKGYMGQVMAKCYSSLAVSGQGGPDGDSDISGLDGGTSNWTRVIFMLNEFTTDEVSWIWPDIGVFDLCTNTWSNGNGNLYGAYGRLYTHIAVCNDFIRQVNDGVFNVSDADVPIRDQFVLEARALRDLSYYYIIDFFGNGVRAWDDMAYGDTPEQVTRKELFDLVTADLEDVLANFKESGIYGRVGKDGVEALLCRYYLNAESWIGENMYAKCWEHAQNIIGRHQGGGFDKTGLAKDYLALFCGSNDMFMPGGSLKDQNEILWGIPFQYPDTESYGGTMFLIAAAVSADNMPAVLYGITDSWACMHAREQFADKFSFVNGVSNDSRTYLWATEQQGFTKTNDEFSKFTSGYAPVKFTNCKAEANGTLPRNTYTFKTDTDDPDNPGEKLTYTFNWAGKPEVNGLPDMSNKYPDTDFPIIRLADVYLMAAECALRGAGDRSKGLEYVNNVRRRAGVAPWFEGDYNLTNMIDERSRELYWENTRRTDLIRFNLFTGNTYNWAWKNNVREGASIGSHMNLFPLPADVVAYYGGKMKLNPGY